jgi:hypothetical protein
MNNTARKIQTRPQVEAVTITPAMASDWLKNTAKNRKAYKTHVGRLANEMVRGNWQLNGETIKFDTFGRLVDGQHRLLAVIEASQPVTMHVCSNLATDSDVFATIDVGMKRTAQSVLRMEGVKNAGIVASAIAFMEQTDSKSTDAVKISNTATLQAYNQEPEKWDKVAHAAANDEVARLIRRPTFCLWFYDALDICETAANGFAEMFKTGANLSLHHPVLTLRRSLTNQLEMSSNVKFRFLQYYKICTAWNAWRDGRKLKRIPATNLPINTRIKLH